MPTIPDPIITPAILPTDFVKEDIPAETDDLQLGERGPNGEPIEKPGFDPDDDLPLDGAK